MKKGVFKTVPDGGKQNLIKGVFVVPGTWLEMHDKCPHNDKLMIFSWLEDHYSVPKKLVSKHVNENSDLIEK